MKIIDVLENEDNTSTLVLDEISQEEFIIFTKIGHKVDPTEFNEYVYFELGIIKVIEDAIKYEENKCKGS